jgi:ABC-type Fe3+/spermidine/putrescine transport system ATPase subunit
MLRVKSLNKSFGAFNAVRNVSLEVAEGELVTLLGPSGCGKSTTLRCIAGLESPTGGEIWMGDECIFSASKSMNVQPEGRRIGMVFQSYALWPHMTVLENVAYPLRRQKLSGAERDRRAMEALELVSLASASKSSPGMLSGGQQQRIALARALASECRILLFDEPLSNLDVRLREQLRNEIRDIQKRLGITAVYVTHDQSEALAISDRIVVMDRGEIVQIDPPGALYARPKTIFAASFLGSVNLLPVTETGGECGRWIVFQGAGKTKLRAPATEGSHGQDAKAQFGVRSELVRLTPPGTEINPTYNSWDCTIESATFLGDCIEYLVRTAEGDVLRVKVPPYIRYQAGQAAVASIAPEDCFIIRHQNEEKKP